MGKSQSSESSFPYLELNSVKNAGSKFKPVEIVKAQVLVPFIKIAIENAHFFCRTNSIKRRWIFQTAMLQFFLVFPTLDPMGMTTRLAVVFRFQPPN